MSKLLSDFYYFDFGLPFPTLTNMKGLVPDSIISTSSIISCRPSPGLTSLPDDVLLLVISLIGVEDILALRMVCAHVLTRPNRPQISDSFVDIKTVFISHQATLGMVGCAQTPCHRQEITRTGFHRGPQVSVRQGAGISRDTCLQVRQKLVLFPSPLETKCSVSYKGPDGRGGFCPQPR
jgi:hypothetical protein